MEPLNKEGIKAFETLGFDMTHKKSGGNTIVYAKKGDVRYSWINGIFLERCIKIKGRWITEALCKPQ